MEKITQKHERVHVLLLQNHNDAEHTIIIEFVFLVRIETRGADSRINALFKIKPRLACEHTFKLIHVHETAG